MGYATNLLILLLLFKNFFTELLILH